MPRFQADITVDFEATNANRQRAWETIMDTLGNLSVDASNGGDYMEGGAEMVTLTFDEKPKVPDEPDHATGAE